MFPRFDIPCRGSKQLWRLAERLSIASLVGKSVGYDINAGGSCFTPHTCREKVQYKSVINRAQDADLNPPYDRQCEGYAAVAYTYRVYYFSDFPDFLPSSYCD